MIPAPQFHPKRLIDLIPPPTNPNSSRQFKMSEHKLETLIAELESGSHTGCLQATSENCQSRSMMLLYRGLAVGCIYNCKNDPVNLVTEKALPLMLNDLRADDSTRITLYDLPDSILLPLCSLFSGYPIERTDDADTHSYIDYFYNWNRGKEQAACLAISLPRNNSQYLMFLYNGEFSGAFYVEEQHMYQDKNFVYKLLATDPSAGLEATILSSEMIASPSSFGFSLTSLLKPAH